MVWVPGVNIDIGILLHIFKLYLGIDSITLVIFKNENVYFVEENVYWVQ